MLTSECCSSCSCPCLVAKLGPTLFRPHGLYSPPSSSVHGTSQARTLEWVALSSSLSVLKFQDFVANIQKIERVLQNSGFWIFFFFFFKADLSRLSLNPFKATVIGHVTSPSMCQDSHQASSPWEPVLGQLLDFETYSFT